MKKVICFLIVFLLLICLVGCNNQKQNGSGDNPKNQVHIEESTTNTEETILPDVALLVDSSKEKLFTCKVEGLDIFIDVKKDAVDYNKKPIVALTRNFQYDSLQDLIDDTYVADYLTEENGGSISLIYYLIEEGRWYLNLVESTLDDSVNILYRVPVQVTYKDTNNNSNVSAENKQKEEVADDNLGSSFEVLGSYDAYAKKYPERTGSFRFSRKHKSNVEKLFTDTIVGREVLLNVNETYIDYSKKPIVAITRNNEYDGVEAMIKDAYMADYVTKENHSEVSLPFYFIDEGTWYLILWDNSTEDNGKIIYSVECNIQYTDE